MYLIQYITAFTAAKELAQREFDYKTAYAIMRLRQRIQPQCEFYADEEAKIISDYAKRDEKGNMIIENNERFVFACPEKAKEYAERVKALGMTEVEDFDPVLHAPEPVSIKPIHLEALESFIVFGGGENE